MKLTALQWIWLIGVVALFGTALLDIADVIAPPDRFWIIAPIALFAYSLIVGPSYREISEAHRRSLVKRSR